MLVYLDDVLIFAATIEWLLVKLELVFRLLINANLKCIASNCLLFTETIHYLGHVVSKASFLLEKSKLDRIEE